MNLPPELLVHCLSYVPLKKDIEKIRLVSKVFAAAGNPFLLQRIYLSCFAADLEVFNNVIKDPVMSRYVDQIICDDTQFSSIHLNRKPCHECCYESELNHGRHVTDRGLFEMRYKQQHDTKRLNLDIKALRAAMKRLPNISTVLITDECHRGARCPHFYQTPFNRLPSYCRTPVPKKWPWDLWDLPGDVWNLRTSPYRQFINLIRTLSIVEVTPISEIRISGKDVGISHRFLSGSLENLTSLRNAFKNLTSLSIHINTHYSEPQWSETMEAGSVGRILSAGTLLE
ncbi:hypothetical protein MMC12_003332 [Toensbergia leucococca]|nr:hypothetical protein [Toensbergia leucococca]